jgi:hypothetical protein
VRHQNPSATHTTYRVAYYYALRKTGGVPREMRVGRRFLISLEAAEWRKARENGDHDD